MRGPILCLTIINAASAARDILSSSTFSKSDLQDVVRRASGEPILDDEPMSSVIGKLASTARLASLEAMASLNHADESRLTMQSTKRVNKDLKDDPYPYFGFIPHYPGNMKPNEIALSFKGTCFGSIVAHAVKTTQGDVTVSITTSNPSSVLCSDVMLLMTVNDFQLKAFEFSGTHKFTWNATSHSEGSTYDLLEVGIRVFVFVSPWTDTLNQILKTAEILIPEMTHAVSPSAAKQNLAFLSSYAGVTMAPRKVTDVILDESDIHSGDFFGIIRLDGLDPILAWAMGSTTGHTAVALWSEDGTQLFVCESTAKGSYWDVNGIQCTPYRTWVAKAKAASFNVVVLPLAQKYRDAFNATTAWEFFRTVEGFDYGYNNMLWGWIDTIKDNYPCKPGTSDQCLSWDLLEVFFPAIGRYIAQFVSFYDQAFNHRLATSGLVYEDLLKVADSKGVARNTLPTLVEQDEWSYNMLRNNVTSTGPSMVCCVFVCRIWKAAGIFSEIDDEINCGELTNWDDYSMQVFDAAAPRPQACVTADPENNVCQILGEYSLHVNNYNSKPMFAHIGEHCPGLAPDYNRPATC